MLLSLFLHVTCLYTKHTHAHTIQTSMPPAEFEPAIPATESLLTYAIDSAAIAVGISTIGTAEFLLETESNSEVKNADGRKCSLRSIQGPPWNRTWDLPSCGQLRHRSLLPLLLWYFPHFSNYLFLLVITYCVYFLVFYRLYSFIFLSFVTLI